MRWYHRHLNLSTKLILSITLVSLFPLILSVIVSDYSIAKFTKKNYVEGNQAILDQLHKRLDSYLDQLNQNSIRFFSDLFYASDVQNLPTGSLEYYNQTLFNLFNLSTLRNETHSAVFYNAEEQETFVVNDSVNASFPGRREVEEMDWYLRLLDSKSRTTIEPLHVLEPYPAEFKMNQNQLVFSINKIFYDKRTVYGILSMNYKPDFLLAMLNELPLKEAEEIMYANPSGAILAFTRHTDLLSNSSDPKLISRILSTGLSKGSFRYQQQKEDKSENIVIYSISPKWGNVLYKVVPSRSVLEEVSRTKNWMLFSSGVLILLLIATTTWLSVRITKPLIQLKRHMIRLGNGDFSSKIPVDSKDEIGAISTTFNQMTHKINEMINAQYKQEIVLQTAQFKTLQAQINPHFMNNTLQAIGGVALAKGVDEIEQMSRTLSTMLRYSISASGNEVSLRAEIENVRDYLSIQKFRFEERLEYEMELDEEVLVLSVPKLILQPLVENAVIHGIERSMEPGVVRVLGRREADELVIVISDTGVGMEPDELAEIRKRLDNKDHYQWLDLQKHGVLNVWYRLKLMYAERFLMEVESSLGVGTIIRLRFRMDTKGENDLV